MEHLWVHDCTSLIWLSLTFYKCAEFCRELTSIFNSVNSHWPNRTPEVFSPCNLISHDPTLPPGSARTQSHIFPFPSVPEILYNSSHLPVEPFLRWPWHALWTPLILDCWPWGQKVTSLMFRAGSSRPYTWSGLATRANRGRHSDLFTLRYITRNVNNMFYEYESCYGHCARVNCSPAA